MLLRIYICPGGWFGVYILCMWGVLVGAVWCAVFTSLHSGAILGIHNEGVLVG